MPAKPRGPHVLLLEDNPSCALLTELTLEEGFADGVRVTHVRSLRDALGVLGAPADPADGGPDVVVADLGLPDAEGMDVILRLRAAGSPPVVVLSGREGAGLAAALQAAGAAGHVLKGHEHDDLAAAITAAIAGA